MRPFCFTLVLILACSPIAYAMLDIEILLDEVYVNVTYDKPFKIINLDDNVAYNITFFYCIGNICNQTLISSINRFKTAGITTVKILRPGNFTICGMVESKICRNLTARVPEACNVTMVTSLEGFVFESGQKIIFRHSLSDTRFPYLIEYHIEDLYGNIVKSKHNSSNTNQKSFSKSVDRESVFLLKSRLHSVCNSQDTSNFFVIKPKILPVKNSSIDIKEIVVKNCDTPIFADLDIYKADTSKTLVELRLKASSYVSDPVKIYLKEKNREYRIKVPIAIKKKGFEYPTLIIDGLGVRVEKDIDLKCEAEIITTASGPKVEIIPEIVIDDIEYDCGEYVKVLFDLDKGTSTKRVLETYIKDGRLLATDRYKFHINKSQRMMISMKLNKNYTGRMVLYFKGLVEMNISLDFDCKTDEAKCPVCNFPPAFRTQIINHTCSYARFNAKEIKQEFFIFPFLGLMCIVLLFR